MQKLFAKFALGAIAGVLAIGSSTKDVAAQSYQIDCAILLCLSGGWPASAPCARAGAEFIRRITPWPVEPPLQIWRCPMGATYLLDSDPKNTPKFWDTSSDPENAGPMSLPMPLNSALAAQPALHRLRGGSAVALPDGFILQLIQDSSGADIDISGPEFNFVRSIRVFNVTFAWQYESGRDESCNRLFALRIGTYGTQGDFRWMRGSNPRQLPEAHIGLERYGQSCPGIFHRSVFVDWRDYQGNYGFEQVNY